MYFKNSSTYKEKYLKKLEGLKKPSKRWCRKHPVGIWGKLPNGEWYTNCTVGNKRNEACEAVTE
jgi:hypothetical protein